MRVSVPNLPSTPPTSYPALRSIICKAPTICPESPNCKTVGELVGWAEDSAIDVSSLSIRASSDWRSDHPFGTVFEPLILFERCRKSPVSEMALSLLRSQYAAAVLRTYFGCETVEDCSLYQKRAPNWGNPARASLRSRGNSIFRLVE